MLSPLSSIPTLLGPRRNEYIRKTEHKVPEGMRDALENIVFRSMLAREAMRVGSTYQQQLKAQKRQSATPYRNFLPGIVGVMVGAAAAFFLDPDMGRRRRSITRDKFWSFLRRGSDRLEGKSRWAAGKAYGVYQEALHAVQPDPVNKSQPSREAFTREPAYKGGARNQDLKRNSSVRNNDDLEERIERDISIRPVPAGTELSRDPGTNSARDRTGDHIPRD